MIPVIGSVLGRPEAGSRPSDRRECGLETPENDSSYWIGAWETRSWKPIVGQTRMWTESDRWRFWRIQACGARGWWSDGSFGWLRVWCRWSRAKRHFAGSAFMVSSEEKTGRLERSVTVHLVAFDQVNCDVIIVRKQS